MTVDQNGRDILPPHIAHECRAYYLSKTCTYPLTVAKSSSLFTELWINNKLL